MEWIDYRTLPPAAGGYSELFFDYVYDYEKVRQFFPTNFRENDSFESVIKGVDAAKVDRRTLEEVLTADNLAATYGVPVRIARLAGRRRAPELNPG